MKATYAPFDAADLDNDEVIAEYLTAAVEDPNPAVFLARSAMCAGLGRESLYKALSTGAHPRYETVTAVLRALGDRRECHSVPTRDGAREPRWRQVLAKARGAPYLVPKDDERNARECKGEIVALSVGEGGEAIVGNVTQSPRESATEMCAFAIGTHGRKDCSNANHRRQQGACRGSGAAQIK